MLKEPDPATGTVPPARTTICRPRGILATVTVSLVVALFATNRRHRRTGRRWSGNAPPLSDALRRDIGLPTSRPAHPPGTTSPR